MKTEIEDSWVVGWDGGDVRSSLRDVFRELIGQRCDEPFLVGPSGRARPREKKAGRVLASNFQYLCESLSNG